MILRLWGLTIDVDGPRRASGQDELFEIVNVDVSIDRMIEPGVPVLWLGLTIMGYLIFLVMVSRDPIDG